MGVKARVKVKVARFAAVPLSLSLSLSLCRGACLPNFSRTVCGITERKRIMSNPNPPQTVEPSVIVAGFVHRSAVAANE
jgi:hypothetical protein